MMSHVSQTIVYDTSGKPPQKNVFMPKKMYHNLVSKSMYHNLTSAMGFDTLDL
jgi:hypothetical protein